MTMTTIIASVIALFVGIAIGWFIMKVSGKRILVIFGAGHMTILNYLFECSPEYKLLHVNDYLK